MKQKVMLFGVAAMLTGAIHAGEVTVADLEKVSDQAQTMVKDVRADLETNINKVQHSNSKISEMNGRIQQTDGSITAVADLNKATTHADRYHESDSEGEHLNFREDQRSAKTTGCNGTTNCYRCKLVLMGLPNSGPFSRSILLSRNEQRWLKFLSNWLRSMVLKSIIMFICVTNRICSRPSKKSSLSTMF